MSREILRDANSSAIKISITGRQNSTWQGIITLTDTGETPGFISVTELMKLMDSVLNNNDS
jgi:hypothetical protein